jgi:hypothetical protein
MTIEFIRDNDIIMAIIIPHDHHDNGINFITPENFSQQLAYMHHPAGKIIQPHVHKPLKREVSYTQEVLVIKRGKLRVDFYNPAQVYLVSRILSAGDTILLASAGHGFEVLEEIEMIEIKQGPYGGGDADKVRFEPISPDKLDIK